MKVLKLKTRKDLRMMRDPYRIDIIQVFRKYDNNPMTVKEVSVEMNEPHGKVYYHMKKLTDYGAMKIVKTAKLNGIVLKYYVLDFEEIAVAGESLGGDDSQQYDDTVMLVSKMFEDAKNGFIEDIKYFKEYKGPQLKKGEKSSSLTSGNLYFDEEGHKAFLAELAQLVKKYESKDEDLDQYKKTLFYSVYSEHEKNDEKKDD